MAPSSYFPYVPKNKRTKNGDGREPSKDLTRPNVKIVVPQTPTYVSTSTISDPTS